MIKCKNKREEMEMNFFICVFAYVFTDEGTSERNGRPDEDANGHDHPTIVTVAKETKQWRQTHVTDDKCRRDDTGQSVIYVIIRLDVTKNTFENHRLQQDSSEHPVLTPSQLYLSLFQSVSLCMNVCVGECQCVCMCVYQGRLQKQPSKQRESSFL